VETNLNLFQDGSTAHHGFGSDRVETGGYCTQNIINWTSPWLTVTAHRLLAAQQWRNDALSTDIEPRGQAVSTSSFEQSQVRLTAPRRPIFTTNVRSFPQPLHDSSGIVPYSQPQPHPSSLIITVHPPYASGRLAMGWGTKWPSLIAPRDWTFLFPTTPTPALRPHSFTSTPPRCPYSVVLHCYLNMLYQTVRMVTGSVRGSIL